MAGGEEDNRIQVLFNWKWGKQGGINWKREVEYYRRIGKDEGQITLKGV